MAKAGPDRPLAIAALLALATAFWLPWWVVRYDDASGVTYETIAPRLFTTADPYTTSVPYLTGALVALVLLALLVRLAGQSWYHEPGAWRATLGQSAGVLAIALATSLAWPKEVPAFWGRNRYEQGGELLFTETALPGLAWWLTLLAAALLGAAWWLMRRELRVSSDTSDK